MGQTLSVPATHKSTETGSNDKYAYGVSEMQGWRIGMEDAHATILKLDADKPEEQANAFFAVYDGHGGAATAKYAGQHVHQRLQSHEAYKQGNYTDALKQAFIDTDADMKDDPGLQRESSGCTAVAALLTHDGRVLVANAGDSRAILCSKGEGIPLSFDHKPENTDEKKRITAAGGYVEFGRVNGNLSLSRALGDFNYKRNPKIPVEDQIVTCNPDIVERQLTEDDEFVVIACDGIWDCLTTQQVASAVRYLISQGKDLGEICEIICDHCLAPDTVGGAGIGCDNMTILIVALLHGRSKEEWQAWITDRVNQKYGHYTPLELPRLYSESRIEGNRRRMAAWEERQRYWAEKERDKGAVEEPHGTPANSQVVVGSGPGMQQKTTGGITVVFRNADGVYTHNDSESEEDSDHEMPADDASDGSSDSTARNDPTESLKAQLDELDREEEARQTKKHKPEHELQGEAPPPPKEGPNGDVVPADVQAMSPDAQMQKASAFAAGDAPSDAVKLEGLTDSSESPFKT